MKTPATVLDEIDARSREVFRRIVEAYLETGEPVGSRSVSRLLPMQLSPASVRNVMTDLEERGLIYAPHTSAGRLPTQSGLRMFVDALLEIGDISSAEQQRIMQQIGGRDRAIEDLLSEASGLLSGLSQCAGLVLTEKRESRLKHIEFVPLDPGKALVVLVAGDGAIENRVIDVPEGLSPTRLAEAGNFLNAKIRGLTINEARQTFEHEFDAARAELDALTARVVEAGIAVWSGGESGARSLIVRGRSHLIRDLAADEDLQRIQTLFDEMESQKDLIEILRSAEDGNGVRIFIGAENKRFSLSGSSIIVAPFQDERSKVVGVLGVIGPTRLNYARIIPVVDYTARLMGRLLS